MCYPVNDQMIMRLIAEGRLFCCGAGRGHVFTRDVRPSHRHRGWREVGSEETAQQAGKRPSAALYRRFTARIDGHVRTFRVNRVIYVYEHGPTHYEIDHVDDDSLHCGRGNLDGKTRFENQAKAMESKWLRENGHGPEDDDACEHCCAIGGGREPF